MTTVRGLVLSSLVIAGVLSWHGAPAFAQRSAAPPSSSIVGLWVADIVNVTRTFKADGTYTDIMFGVGPKVYTTGTYLLRGTSLTRTPKGVGPVTETIEWRSKDEFAVRGNLTVTWRRRPSVLEELSGGGRASRPGPPPKTSVKDWTCIDEDGHIADAGCADKSQINMSRNFNRLSWYHGADVAGTIAASESKMLVMIFTGGKTWDFYGLLYSDAWLPLSSRFVFGIAQDDNAIPRIVRPPDMQLFDPSIYPRMIVARSLLPGVRYLDSLRSETSGPPTWTLVWEHEGVLSARDYVRQITERVK